MMKFMLTLAMLMIVCMQLADGMAKSDPGELEDALNEVLENVDSTPGW